MFLQNLTGECEEWWWSKKAMAWFCHRKWLISCCEMKRPGGKLNSSGLNWQQPVHLPSLITKSKHIFLLTNLAILFSVHWQQSHLVKVVIQTFTVRVPNFYCNVSMTLWSPSSGTIFLWATKGAQGRLPYETNSQHKRISHIHSGSTSCQDHYATDW